VSRVQPVGFITFHSKHDAEVARQELQVRKAEIVYYSCVANEIHFFVSVVSQLRIIIAHVVKRCDIAGESRRHN